MLRLGREPHRSQSNSHVEHGLRSLSTGILASVMSLSILRAEMPSLTERRHASDPEVSPDLKATGPWPWEAFCCPSWPTRTHPRSPSNIVGCLTSCRKSEKIHLHVRCNERVHCGSEGAPIDR